MKFESYGKSAAELSYSPKDQKKGRHVRGWERFIFTYWTLVWVLRGVKVTLHEKLLKDVSQPPFAVMYTLHATFALHKEIVGINKSSKLLRIKNWIRKSITGSGLRKRLTQMH